MSNSEATPLKGKPATASKKSNSSQANQTPKHVTYATMADESHDHTKPIHSLHDHAEDTPLMIDLEQGQHHPKSGNGSIQHSHSHSHGGDDSHSHSHSHGGGGEDGRVSPRSAYQMRDVDASKRAHAAKKKMKQTPVSGNGGDDDSISPDQLDKEGGHAGDAGDYIKSIVYGGLDGIITTFATVTSVAGAEFSAAVIVVLGISHLFADGLSMGMGDYMSSQAEIDFTASERAREKWEMDNNMKGEIEEMIDLYVEKGISETDARIIINTMAKYPDAFLDNMMVVELGLLPPADDKGFSPKKAGFITMLSFMCFGSVPLLPYLIGLIPGVDLTTELQLTIAVTSTIITLFALGVVKGRIAQVGRSSWWKSGLMMAANGSGAAAVGFICGALISNWMDLPPGAG